VTANAEVELSKLLREGIVPSKRDCNGCELGPVRFDGSMSGRRFIADARDSRDDGDWLKSRSDFASPGLFFITPGCSIDCRFPIEKNYIVYILASTFLKIKGCYLISTAAYEVIECQTYVRSGYILFPAGFKVQTIVLTVVLDVEAVVDAPLGLYDCISCCSFAKSCWAPLRLPDWSA
jgi:hypothetical protein